MTGNMFNALTIGRPILKSTLSLTHILVHRHSLRLSLSLRGSPNWIYFQMLNHSLHTTAIASHNRCRTPKNVKAKNVTSRQWLLRQLNDPYVARAKENNYRCRSAFKLLEIDAKYKILKRGDVVIDCGASPGSWTQVAVNRVFARPDRLCSDDDGYERLLHDVDGCEDIDGDPTAENREEGKVIAIDLQSIAAIEGATILSNSDFCHPTMQKKIMDLLKGRHVDVVLSDMAPKPSGIKSMDHEVIVDLCMASLKFACGVLPEQKGHFLCKLWQGFRMTELQIILAKCFHNVKVIKPPATRSQSAEIYMLGSGLKLKRKSPLV